MFSFGNPHLLYLLFLLPFVADYSFLHASRDARNLPVTAKS